MWGTFQAPCVKVFVDSCAPERCSCRLVQVGTSSISTEWTPNLVSAVQGLRQQSSTDDQLVQRVDGVVG